MIYNALRFFCVLGCASWFTVVGFSLGVQHALAERRAPRLKLSGAFKDPGLNTTVNGYPLPESVDGCWFDAEVAPGEPPIITDAYCPDAGVVVRVPY